jgi:C1A family cysteine protease
MKKRFSVTVVVVTLSVAGIIMLTSKDTGKDDFLPGFAYHGVEENSLFETGFLEGELRLAPLNQEFMEFGESPQQHAIRRREATSDTGKGLGLIPSPIAPEIHQRVLAKGLRGSALESRYDLRDPNNDGQTDDSALPPVRNQGECGACWAFATYGGIEAMHANNYSITTDFSENNVLYRSGYDWGECVGGNVDMSMAYLSRNAGPVKEHEDPFSQYSTSYCQDCTSSRYIDSVVKLPARSGVTDIDYIKQAIKDYGSIYASMYWDEDNYSASDNTFYSSRYKINHSVTVIGWDDGKVVNGAPDKGAFIARNSWGSDWGENGYFYVSYYDNSFGFSTLAAFVDKPDSLLLFDRIYYHDPLGMTSSTGYGSRAAWGANIFTPDEDGFLVAVSLFTTASETNYEIMIYDNFNGESFEKARGGVFSGALKGKGYHTIPLDREITISDGDDFALVVKFDTPTSRWPIPLEKPFNSYSSGAVANPGEGYISPNGSDWTDVTDNYPDANVCIKALVRERSCEDDGLFVIGPGNSNVFLIENNEGSFVKAVVTDGCGKPVSDVEVVAELNSGDTELILFDDGLHNDSKSDDGIYGNALDANAKSVRSDVVIRTSKNGNSNYSTDEVRTLKATDSAVGDDGGKGCFINSAY